MDLGSYEAQAKASRQTGGLIPHPLVQPLSGGPFGSPMEVALFGKTPESPSSSSSSSGSSASGEGGGAAILMALFAILMALFAPPFVAPGYALYRTWMIMSAARWHPLFKILADSAEILALCAMLWALYRFVPRLVGALLAALYIGVCYATALRWMGADDRWAAGIGGATAIGGYFLGHWAHKTVASSMVTFRSAGYGLINSYSIVSAIFSLLLYWVTCLGGGGWAIWKFCNYANHSGWAGFTTFMVCSALGAAAIFVPLFLIKKLVKYVSRWFALGVIMGVLALVAGIICYLAGFDPVWTVAAIVSAGIGGRGVAQILVPTEFI